MGFVPLHVHSQYSILNSTVSVTGLAEKAKTLGMEALALTDEGNLYGAIDFYKACKLVKIKPIFGCHLWMAPFSRLEKKKMGGLPSGFPIVLLAKNITGYHNLCKLSSIGFLDGFYYQPRIDKEILAAHKEGLICLSEGQAGPIGFHFVQKNQKAAEEEMGWYQTTFRDDFYFELQKYPFIKKELEADGVYQESWLVQKMENFAASQEWINHCFIEEGKKRGIRCVATNSIHYLERKDFLAHEILLNIQSGEPREIWERDSQGNLKQKALNPKRETAASHDFYFKSQDEMKALFSEIPEAVEESGKIAELCSVELDFKTKHYPVFIPPGLEGKKVSKQERRHQAEQFLKNLCQQAMPIRYSEEKLRFVAAKYPGKDPWEVVQNRFEYEFEILASKEMSDYMLIVYDFIAWAKQRQIPMGPGRGSAAGSIISYLIGITDIEPLRFHLFFERFINPERISYPDIDVDICMDRRQEVIEYVIQKYGKEKVAQIITFGTMKAKMAIRDVGRVLNVPLSKVNQIASLVPEDPTMTLEKAFEMDPELRSLSEDDEEAKQVLEMARKIEGSIRNTSTHAAGLIISAHPITDHIPVCTAKDSAMIVTQFAMKPVESVGMLKIDFLGLKTLTSIQKCVDAIEKNQKKKIDWANLPLDDQATFSLLNQGYTLGVFQLESEGMKDLSKQLHIDTFEEIIAVGALYRPGPMDMIPSFISRKHGTEVIEFDHPLMKDILAETYGVMVYQEQVMQIASALAGYTLGEGDVLRRAMGKKDKEEMARQREKFIKGAEERGISSENSIRIFDKIEKFASYGFNKSHAAAYAYLSYTTAYFKANYPSEWMASLMTCDRDDTDKIAKFIGEARSMQIPVLLPDINQSAAEFTATPSGIRFAMSGIKGVGRGAVDLIVEEREKNGPYQSLYQFIQRIDKSKVGKKQMELLVEAGCFDFSGWTRDELRESVDPMVTHASKEHREESLGILNLFSLIEEPKSSFDEPPVVSKASTKIELLRREKELLGFYLTGHPMDEYQSLFKRLSCVPLKEMKSLSDGAFFRTAFLIESIDIKISNKTQKKFAILHVGDGHFTFELPIWAEMFEEKAFLLNVNQCLYAILQIDMKLGSLKLSCRYLDDLASVNEEKIKAIDLVYDRLKEQTKLGEPKWKTMKPKEASSGAKEELKPLILTIDADRIQMSQILQLKELFRSHPGTATIELKFISDDHQIGAVTIDSKWGVSQSAPFTQALTDLLKSCPATLDSIR
jgi:DNA polymerase-3 subunit alpha